MNGEQDLEFTSGSSRKVHLREAEHELNRLWEMAGDEARSHGSESVTRLRELNLVIYAAGEVIADHVSSVISRLSQRHPARAVVLLELADGPAASAPAASTVVGDLEAGRTPSGEAAPPLDAWVTAACYLSREGSRHVCWEQVTVPARGDSVRLLHAAAVSLLVPDLPTVLWWPGEPEIDGVAFRRLGEVSDLVIVDSAGFTDPLGGLSRLARVAYDGSRNHGLGDLNWTRLSPWRDMTAELFDDPAHLPWLGRIRRVVLSYGTEDPRGRADCSIGPAAARALLFGGWLISRLGWSADRRGWVPEGDGAKLTLHAQPTRAGAEAGGGEGAIELVFRCVLTECGPLGGLSGLHLVVGSDRDQVSGRDQGSDRDQGSEVRLSLELSSDDCVGSARVIEGEQEHLVRTYDLTPAPEDRLLADELDYMSPDAVYEEALLTAATLATLPGAALLGGTE